MSAPHPSSIGRNEPRADAFDKVTGRAVYVDDIVLPGMLHGATVRSEFPRGRITAIELDPAFDWSGVTFLDWRALPGPNVLPLLENDQPVLVEREVRHRHEPIALLACACPHRLAQALRHVRVTYEARPIVSDIEDALEAKDKIHGDDNVYAAIEIEKGDPDRFLGRDDLVVVEEIFTVGRQEQLYIEPQGMIAEPLADGGICVTGSMQCPYYVHRALVAVLALDDPRKARVVQAETGGGFGGKEEYPSHLAVHAALLARAVGAPVKMVYSRREDMLATPKRHPGEIIARAVFDADGRLKAADVDIVLDGGAYCTLSPVVLSRAVLHATSAYRLDDVHVSGRVVATNNPPSGAFRGFGAPQAVFAFERLMDISAERLGLPPDEIRRRNLLRVGDSTSTGQILEESVSIGVLLERCLDASRYRSLRAELDAQPRDASKRRGIGLATWMHGCGFTGRGETRLASRAQVRVELDPASPTGCRVRVLAAAAEIGQGARTTLAQIAADALAVPLETVFVPPPDTAAAPDSGPTVASRTCMVVGGLVERAARRLGERLRGGDPSRSLAEVLIDGGLDHAVESADYAPPPGVDFDERTYSGAAYASWGFAAVVVLVEVDLATCEVEILEVTTCQDVGRAVNPMIVEGQIEGGVAQALGYGHFENVVMVDGSMQNPSLADYVVPTSLDLPRIRVLLHEEPFSGGPGGAKGVGEMPIDGPAAALVAAISDAAGVVIRRVPATPELIAVSIAEGSSRSRWRNP